MQQRGFLIRAMSLIAVGFGLLTIKEGGAILFGGEAAQASAGNFVPFVLWFNFLAGLGYDRDEGKNCTYPPQTVVLQQKILAPAAPG